MRRLICGLFGHVWQVVSIQRHATWLICQRCLVVDIVKGEPCTPDHPCRKCRLQKELGI